ncbi:MAG: pantetheine-phosphate adenylyltransferase [Comamonas sp.]|uniref:pantetheine-phosphate adenylyltransferase n=1 Tax=Comamonas sp. TaxID=34028 RepID=UPI002FC78F6F
MAEHVVAVYPGTFDPITLGHEDMIRRASQMFGQVIVGVATAHHKKTMFTLDERLAMAREVFRDVPNVSVASFEGLVRDFVAHHGAKVMVRGLRSGTDFDYEFQLAGMNKHLMPEAETVFLTPSAETMFISSTLVREIATLGGDEVRKFVSPTVLQQLLGKLKR